MMYFKNTIANLAGKPQAFWRTPACFNICPSSHAARQIYARVQRGYMARVLRATSTHDRSLSVIRCRTEQQSDSVAQAIKPAVAESLSPQRRLKNRLDSHHPRAFSTTAAAAMPLEAHATDGISRMAVSIEDVQEAVHLNEPKMCVQAIFDVLNDEAETSALDSKILDFGAGRGQLG